MNKNYKATLLTDEAGYELTEELADSFNGMDVTVGPKTLTPSMKNPAGIVNKCTVGDSGIVASVTIYDENVSKILDSGNAAICPILARELGGDNRVNAMDVFVTKHPSEDVGGVVEE